MWFKTLKKKNICIILCLILLSSYLYINKNSDIQSQKNSKIQITTGTKYYKNFSLDNVFQDDQYGDIHYNAYIPKAYDKRQSYALYITLPGYQGLYFQGVGKNLETEEFGFVSQNYNAQMIVLAPQLEDWDELSANQTIALTKYFLKHYNIDKNKVYISGYSGGGATLSWILTNEPELYRAALMCSSKWDGNFNKVVKNKTPIYFVIGEEDEYYGSTPFKEAYQQIVSLYKKEGLNQEEIDQFVILDVKNKEYFTSQGITNEHGYGGHLFANDEHIMGWLFNR